MDENKVYTDEKIDYTGYLADKQLETDIEKQGGMIVDVFMALQERGTTGNVVCQCYADDHVKVTVDGEFYGVFDCDAEKFFEGYAGD